MVTLQKVPVRAIYHLGNQLKLFPNITSSEAALR